MKKRALICAAAIASCGGALAQSSVNIFGTVDLAVRHVHAADATENSVGSNGASTSKIGFNGFEDLGGGLKAGFWLEAQLDPNFGGVGGSNGTATAVFNRRSTVSLLGNWGEIRLGRDYVPTFFGIADFDPFNTNGVGNALNLINQDSLGSGVVTQTRANNAVSYLLPPNLGGFFGSVMLSASNNLPGQKYAGFRAGYASGPLRAQLAYGQTDTANPDAPKFKQSNVSASYDFRVVKLTGFVNTNRYNDKKATIYLLGAIVPVGAGEFHVAYEKRNASGGGTDRDDAKQLIFGYLHNLSKRTALYGNIGRLSNEGNAKYVMTGGPGVGSAVGFGSTGAEIGLRHHF